MCDKLNNGLNEKWMDWIEWMRRVDLKSGAVPDLTNINFCIICIIVSLCP